MFYNITKKSENNKFCNKSNFIKKIWLKFFIFIFKILFYVVFLLLQIEWILDYD